MTGVAAQGAMLVPDMNGDGADEVLVSTEGTGKTGPRCGCSTGVATG